MNILITSVGCAPQSSICRSLKNSDYFILGIDMQDLCVGNFICDKYISCSSVKSDNYKNFIENILDTYKINCIFVGSAELLFFSIQKEFYEKKFNCRIFINNTSFIKIANNKKLTYDFCKENNINIPEIKKNYERPIIIKPKEGCGSIGVHILKSDKDKNIEIAEDCIIQKFIEGDEYTVDILSDNDGNFMIAVPKKRLLVKNGQSFKSIVCKDESVINFCRDICNKMKNKSAINIQVIKENTTNKIFLIEINPRFATTINLSIEAGVNIPKMMIENDYSKNDYQDGLVMVRDYKEYFVSNRKK